MFVALLPEASDPVEFWSTYYRPFAAAGGADLAALFGSSAVHLAARREVAGARRVVDAGCGLGVLGLMCRDLPARVVGVDQAGPLLDSARRMDSEAELRVGGLDRLPVESSAFDLVVALSALECTALGLAPSLSEVRRVLEPGGRLFAPCLRLPLALRIRRSVPHTSTLGDVELVRARRIEARHRSRTVAVYYSGRELREAARRAGLVDVDVQPCDALGGLAFAPPLPSALRRRLLAHLGEVGRRHFEGRPRAVGDRLLVEHPEVAGLGRALAPLRWLGGSWNILRARRPLR